MTNAILLLKAYYAVVVYILVPLGVIFFSFGAGCAIKGVFAVVAGGDVVWIWLTQDRMESCCCLAVRLCTTVTSACITACSVVLC